VGVQALTKLGVEAIEPLGQVFDPNVHMAIQQAESKEYPEGVVRDPLPPPPSSPAPLYLSPSPPFPPPPPSPLCLTSPTRLPWRKHASRSKRVYGYTLTPTR
jgi:hypothetical protein